MAGRFDQKKRPDMPKKQDADVGREQEEATPELEAPEPEHQRLQGQMGNQGVMSMISARGGMGGAGGASLEVDGPTRKKDAEKESPLHGGDDAGDPGPLTVADLTQSWNPGTRKSQDRPGFLEPMPGDELPPEDADFLASLPGEPNPWDLPASRTLDALLQPSPDVVRVALTEWSRAASEWKPPQLAWQAVAHIVAPAAPLLQDPHGRLLFPRARQGAISSCLLMASPTLSAEPTVPATAAIAFCLEMRGHRHRARTIRILTEQAGAKELPVAHRIFQAHIDLPPAQVTVREPTAGGLTAFEQTIAQIGELSDPHALVPDLTLYVKAETEDDPLGIDSVLEAFTGGPIDPEDSIYQAAIQAAERLAAEAARSRIRYAGTAVTLAEVARLWSTGAPTHNLVHALVALDRDIAGVLQLLVEIARAAQRRSVPGNGLRTGLRRGAKALAKVWRDADRTLALIAWAILPGDPALVRPVAETPEALVEAWSVGQPAQALPWLLAQPPSLDRDTAVCFTQIAAGATALHQVESLRSLRDLWKQADDPLMTTAVGVVLAPALLFVGALDEAEHLGEEHLRIGQQRRNGLLVADAAITIMEARLARADLEGARRAQRRAGNLLWRMGAVGPLSLLARWSPPDAEDFGS